MISADTIVCQIASENSVKLEKFFCTVANPVDSADSQTWAAWAGVLVAVFAVIAAIRAWFTSIQANEIATKNLEQTIAGLEKQMEHSTKSLEQQLMAALDLSREERRHEQLRLYCDQLIEFGANAGELSAHQITSLESDDKRVLDAAMAGARTDYDLHRTRLTAKWASWTFYLDKDDDELREASRRWHDYLLLAGQQCVDKAFMRHVRTEADDDFEQKKNEYADSRKNLINVTGGLVGNYQKTWWEGPEKQSALNNIYALPNT